MSKEDLSQQAAELFGRPPRAEPPNILGVAIEADRRQKMATKEHWIVLLDWIEWLQREAPRRTPEQMRAAMAYADASFAAK